MWLAEHDLHALGFRRRSRHYWQCERRFGLPGYGYLSLFVGHECDLAGQCFIEFSAFHVTFLLGMDNVHFYYHEHDEDVWEPGGHTSSVEIERHGVEPRGLRALADEIAERVMTALDRILVPRE